MPWNGIALQTMDDMPCGFLSTSEKGDILHINNTLLQYLEYSREEFSGKNIEDILSLSSRIFYQTHFYPLILLKGHADEIFLTLRSKHQTQLAVLINAVKKNSEPPVIINWIIIPVRQRGQYEEQLLLAKKTAEEALHKNLEFIKAKADLELNKEELDRKVSRLEQKNDELVQFTSVISHDLQEPLRKISLFADLLLTENKHLLTPKGHYSLEMIHKSCNRIREIVFNLEKLVSLEMAEEQVDNVDLNKVLAAVKEKITLGTNKMDFMIHAEKLPVIEGYPKQLEILFHHLIENALKFSNPSKAVVIDIHNSLIQHNMFKQTKDKYKYTEFVKITFADNGLGFDNTYKDYIFLILKKLQNDKPGLGFGLAFCKKVVDNHLGSISADAIIGKGSTFTVLLPLQHHK